MTPQERRPERHPFGEKLQPWLEKSGLRQKDLAREAGVDAAVITHAMRQGRIGRSTICLIIEKLLDHLEPGSMTLEQANELLTTIPPRAVLDERIPAEAVLQQRLLQSATRSKSVPVPSSSPKTLPKENPETHEHSAKDLDPPDGPMALGGENTRAEGNQPLPIISYARDREVFVSELLRRYTGALRRFPTQDARIPLRFHLRFDLTGQSSLPLLPALSSCEDIAGASIDQVYQRYLRGFLLLGGPGAGKTTLLTELALWLLERAQHDLQQPIPVPVNLSSWSRRHLPLEEWIIEDLDRHEHIPRDPLRTWFKENRLILLLDGLEEVAPTDRLACLKAIRDYQRRHLNTLVVSCREQEYLHLQEPGRVYVTLPVAILIQPVTEQQVRAYLARQEKARDNLLQAFERNPSLWTLVQNLFVLRVLLDIYEETTPKEPLPRSSESEPLQQIFTIYTQRMIQRDTGNTSYPPERIRFWLSWLAWQMQQQRLTTFFLEDLQPDWLLETQDRRRYSLFALRFPAIVLGILVSIFLSVFVRSLLLGDVGFTFPFQAALLGGFLSDLFSLIGTQPEGNKATCTNSRPVPAWLPTPLGVITVFAGAMALSWIEDWSHIGQPLLWGDWLWNGLLSSGLLGLSGLVVSWTLFKGLVGKNNQRPAYLLYGILAGLLLGGGSGGATFLKSLLNTGMHQAMVMGLTSTLFSSLIFGGTGVIISLFHCGRQSDIRPAERIELSRSSFIRSLLKPEHLHHTLLVAGIIGALGVGNFLGSGVFGTTQSLLGGLRDGGLFGLGGGFIYWITAGFFYSISSKTFDKDTCQRAIPNHGMHLSFHHALNIGVVTSLVSGLSWFFGGFLTYTPSNILHDGLRLGITISLRYAFEVSVVQAVWFGLLIGFASGLVHGGEAVLKHSVLRFLLRTQGVISRDYPAFLNRAAQHGLIQKVGGGYRFLHASFQHYLASLFPNKHTSM